MRLKENAELDTLLHQFIDRPEPDTFKAIVAFIESRERKAFEAGCREYWDGRCAITADKDFEAYKNSPYYLSEEIAKDDT